MKRRSFLVGSAGLAFSSAPFAAKAQPVTVENMQILRGSFSLPKDFKPAQATVQVMDRASSRQLGMRVLLVK